MLIKLINRVLKGEIKSEKILDWLTTDNPLDIVFPDVVQNESTRVEFVLTFLDYLREQCQGILEPGTNESNGLPQTPSKKDKINTIIDNNNDTLNKQSDKNKNLENRMLRLDLSSDNKTTILDSPNRQCDSYQTSTPVKTIIHQKNKSFNASSSSNFTNILSPTNSSALRSDNQSSSSTAGIVNISFGDVSIDSSISSPQTTKNSIFNDSIISSSSAVASSPLSPLYTSQVSTKNSSRNNKRSNNKNNSQNLDKSQNKKSFTLADFVDTTNTKVFKNDASTEKDDNNTKNKSRSRRRIKPTKLNVSSCQDNQQQQVFGIITRPVIKNPQFYSAEPTENNIASFETERELLKLERQRQIDVPITDTSNIEQKCLITQTKTSTIILAKIELVDEIKSLDILANIYGQLISNNLVPNPMSELYFIITLITSQFKNTDSHTNSDSFNKLKENMGCQEICDDKNIIINHENDRDKSTNETQYLSTIHQCIYFATKVLASLKNLLTALDRTTIKLLSQNINVINFQSDLHDYLTKLYDEKYKESRIFKQNEQQSTEQTNVCFHVETDNLDHFPSPLSFSTFRKQRDLFYEIIKIWEDNHLSPDWNFSSSLGRKINTMLTMHNDTVNYFHIARLFKSQLLISSMQYGQVENPIITDDYNNILESLKNINPEKLKQLQERLVTPVQSIGPVPKPLFFGVQEFYRDFLLTSSNAIFNTILENSLIQEITLLNNTKFTCSDLDIKSEKSVDENTKEKYMICISNLRVLSKFLGFLISIPYKSEINNLDIISTQISLRNNYIPSLDLLSYINDAIKNGKLSLTIPWIVEYLAMLDVVSLRLSYYIKILEILYCIYRTSNKYMCNEASLLITFSIGWLFEQPNFPKNLYCNWQMKFSQLSYEQLGIVNDDNNVIKKQLNVNTLVKEQNSHNNNNIILDKMNLIDVRALYICCPFLREFKILLTHGKTNISQNNTSKRHITPVSCQLSQPSSQTKAKTIELQLEEAFFHGHQSSVKNTVDFVAERVASSCVKYICRIIIPDIKNKHLLMMKKFIDNDRDKRPDSTCAEILQMMSDKFSNIIIDVTDEIRNKIDEIITAMCKDRITNAMTSLLAEDMHEQVKNMCIQISIRMSLERIHQWFDSYIKDAFSSKDFYTKSLSMSNKNVDKTLPPFSLMTSKKIIHNDNALAPTLVINAVRNMMWELIEKHGKWAIVTKDNILKILNNLEETFCQRIDLVHSVKSMMYPLSFDFALHIIVFDRQLFDIDVEDKFIVIWKICKNDQFDQLFAGLLSPRNMKLFTQTFDPLVWQRYGILIRRLLKENLIEMENFSDQCIALFRHEWPINILRGVAQLLTETIDKHKCTDEHAEKIKYFIDWTAEMCAGFDF
ncbi:hypothetical protein HCN44_007677 [Aphidius gifuensis]|uniref:Codanin-1 C-terminal domain-containing protein n=1 Tax=Aphidius gifuensis TaxID=684658 RepID=A0A834XJ91_APHGI|nr:codanin-1 [Aphidius gifuensis]KAF7988183.1 hypothetical protein HCN44_007677 [Aphidius gifuensis]